MVGGADRVLVMLDHDDGVTQIAQALQRFEQAIVVALVQPDARFVEDVEHAAEPAADLAGEADALALPAAERAGRAIEVEVIEPDIVEEAQPLADLLQDGGGDLRLLRCQVIVEREEPVLRRRHAHRDGCGDIGRSVGARHLYRQRLVVEALAPAGLARLRGLEPGQLLAHPGGFGLHHAAVEVADHPFERLVHRVLPPPVLERERDRLALRAVQDNAALFVGQLVPRRGDREPERLGEAGEHLHVIGRRGVRFRPRHDRALLQRQRLVGHDELFVEQLFFADAVAGGARALGAVEREQARLDLLDREAADGTGEAFGEHDAVVGEAGAFHLAFRHPSGSWGLLRSRAITRDPSFRWDDVGNIGICQVHVGQPVRQLQRGFERVRQARLDPVLHGETIDHHLDVVLELLVERGRVLDPVQLAVDAHAGKAGLLPFGKLAAIFTLPPAHDGREQVGARALGQGHHPVDHLADGLRRDRLPGCGAVGDADPRP